MAARLQIEEPTRHLDRDEVAGRGGGGGSMGARQVGCSTKTHWTGPAVQRLTGLGLQYKDSLDWACSTKNHWTGPAVQRITGLGLGLPGEWEQ